MTKRRWIVAALLAACAALPMVVLVILLLLPGGNVNQANFDRIENGMTLIEVEAILGRTHESVGSQHFWEGEEDQVTLIVVIDLDLEEKVANKTLHKIQLDLLNRILNRLGL
jgi:hypothetical protein